MPTIHQWALSHDVPLDWLLKYLTKHRIAPVFDQTKSLAANLMKWEQIDPTLTDYQLRDQLKNAWRQKRHRSTSRRTTLSIVLDEKVSKSLKAQAKAENLSVTALAQELLGSDRPRRSQSRQPRTLTSPEKDRLTAQIKSLRNALQQAVVELSVLKVGDPLNHELIAEEANLIRLQLFKGRGLQAHEAYTESQRFSRIDSLYVKTYLQDPKPLGHKDSLRSLNRRLHATRMPEPGTLLSDINLAGMQMNDQLLAHETCTPGFVNSKRIAVIRGNNSKQRTLLACAIGSEHCEQGVSVRYERAAELLKPFSQSSGINQFELLRQRFKKIDLLIIDGLDDIQLDRSHLETLTELIEVRIYRGATILVGNLDEQSRSIVETQEAWARLQKKIRDDTPIALNLK